MRKWVPAPALQLRARGWLIVVMCLALAGCGLSSDREPEPAPSPAPSRTVPLDTIAAAAEGERIVLTAGVIGVLGDRAFVVIDVDLPDQGLLVLTPEAVDVGAPDLVTVDGVLRRFTFPAFRVPFGLVQAGPYEPFEGRKVLVAADVRSLA